MAAKIMLVEDDTNLSEIYQARLEAEGYQIISAKDGEEALALAIKEKPDLIISDVMMPKISGFDMLDILRGTEGIKHTKVIMMTALGQSEDKSRADKLGADRYLVKSQVTLEDVIKTIHEVLEGAGAAALAPTSPVPAAPAAASTPAAPPTPTPPTPPANAATPSSVPESLTPTPVPVAPAVVSEPASPAPAPTTPPTPPPAEPTPVSDTTAPPATTVPAASPVTSVNDPLSSVATAASQTASTEQNQVLSQIQNFLNQQESSAEQTETPIDPPSEVAEPTPAGQIPPAKAPVQTAPAAPRTIDVVTPTSSPAQTLTPSAAATTEPQSEQVEIANKKVIQPLSDPTKPKTDLNALLAKEQEAGTAEPSIPPAQTVIPVVSESTDAAVQHQAGSIIAPNAPAPPEDPNSIAL